MKYNLETLSFLISSFKELTASFGENSKTVTFFRNNVRGLVNIGQIGDHEASLIFDLIGMQNTDAIKWEFTNKRIEQYTFGVNSILSYNSQDTKVIEALIYNLKQNGKLINPDVEALLKQTFGVSNKERPVEAIKQSFGTMDYKSSEAARKLDYAINFFTTYPDYYIRVRNSGAVCSGDPMYYTLQVGMVMRATNIHTALVELAKGSKFTICVEKTSGDPCHGSAYYEEIGTLTQKAQKIDWKIVLKQYESGDK